MMPMAGFGAAYALASLSCTVGPFLAIVVSAFRAGSAAAGIGLFAAYAAGMGLVVGVASASLAMSGSWMLSGLRRLAPVVSRVGGLVVLVSGAYVAYYGWYEIAVLRGGDPADPVVARAVAVQTWLAGGVDRVGITVLVAVLALLVTGVVLVGPLRRMRDRQRTAARERVGR
jgi:hypothetical protein